MKKILILIIGVAFSLIGYTQIDTKDIALPGIDSAREMSAAVDPTFHKNVYFSTWIQKFHQNIFMTNTPPGFLWNESNSLVTTDGGKSWQGRPELTYFKSDYSGTFNSIDRLGLLPNTDPVAVIGKDGIYRFFGLAHNGSWATTLNSKDQGITWELSNNLPLSLFTGLDKPHVVVDNSETSPYKGSIYFAATSSSCGAVTLNYSRDGGITWPTDSNKDPGNKIPGSNTCIVNIATGKNGDVYITGQSGSGLNFYKSTNGGSTFSSSFLTFTSAVSVFSVPMSNCNLGSYNWTYTSNPVILADLSDKSTNNQTYSTLYIAFAGRDNNGQYNVFVTKSFDNGLSWGQAIPVCTILPDDKMNFLPWATIDPETGSIAVIYLSNRNYPIGCEFDMYVATSTDGNNSWTEMKLNDFSFDFSASPFVSGPSGSGIRGRIGEYNSITSSNGMVYPFWMDTRNTKAQVYTSPFVLPSCDTTLPVTLTITNPIDSSFKAKAKSTIIANNQIAAGAKVKYVSGEYIELNPPFATELSTASSDYFTAYINQGCSNPLPFTKLSLNAETPVCSGTTLHLQASSIAGASYIWTGPNGFSSNQQEPQLINVTNLNSGNYTCTVTLPNSITISETIEINVIKKPNKVVVKNLGGDCNYTYPVTFKADYNSELPPAFLWTYQYNEQSTVLEMNRNLNLQTVSSANYGPGIYKCIVSDRGCETSASYRIFNIPYFDITGDICTQGFTISIVNISDYGSTAKVSWTGPNGFTSNMYPLLLTASNWGGPGTYTGQVIAANGCIVQNTFTELACEARIAPITKANIPLQEGIEMKVFPNPTAGSFKIETSRAIEDGTIQVLDMNGKIVYQNRIETGSKVIAVNLPTQLASGAYTVTLKYGKQISSIRIIKQYQILGGNDTIIEQVEFKSKKSE